MNCKIEYGVYAKNYEDNRANGRVILWLYIDDLLIMGNNDELIRKCKEELMKEFEINDLERLNYFLGIEFT